MSARDPLSGLLGVLVLAALGACRGADSRAPSLLLVTLDAIPASMLSAWSVQPVVATPVIDGLAARGAVVARAQAVSPVTLPSHSSILTGLSPARHGVWTQQFGPLPAERLTLAEVLGAAGYRSAAFVSADVLDDEHGLAQGFGLYRDPVFDIRERTQGGALPRLGAEEVTERALAWLGEDVAPHPRDPFFAWIHYFDAHDPVVPSPSVGVVGDPRAQAVAAMDAQLGRVLGGLATLGRDEDCLVVVLSDHGEGEDYQHVPLVMAGPGVSPGLLLDASPSHVDLMPTILELLGREPLPDLDGASFAPALRGPVEHP